MNDKPFKTYDEQIQLLKDKGLIISNEDFAKKTLRDISYFALINGYKKEFKQNNRYDNIYFEDIVSLFRFDEMLREILLKYILIVERRVKSSISYHFSEKYPNCQLDYLNVNNYDYQNIKNRDSILKLIATLQTIIKSKNYPYINHYVNNHNSNIPLWVLINAVSFGKVSKIYALSQQSIQQKVAGDFNNVSNAELKNMLSLLTHFRNVCAHNERLYNYKTRISLKMTKLFSAFHINKNDDCNLFSVVICFKYLLNDTEFTCFVNELSDAIFYLDFDNDITSKESIVKAMGFPDDWQRINDMDLNKIYIKTYTA